MDQLVRFFFKHERTVFTNGQFSFETRPSLALLTVCALLIGGFIYYIYIRRRPTRLASSTLAGLIALRVFFIALIIFMLLRPVMVVPSVIPRSTYVALLTDDSMSMQLTDEAGGRTRLEAVRTGLLEPQGDFLKRLEERFKTNLYGFSDQLAKISSAEELSGSGVASDLTGALNGAQKTSSGMPLSAIVLVSDGAANVSSRDLAAELRELRSRNLPVFTVGVGSTNRFRDAELMRVSVPRRILAGSSVNAEALVRLSGYDATKVLLAVHEDGRAIKTEEFSLRGNEAQTVTLELKPTAAGLRRYTFSITPLEDELTLENNHQEALVEVDQGPSRVLYIEGEPRWELGKMRASLSRDEKNVVLVSMMRSGDNKFYRQGVEGESELAGGFPKTEEELFAYQGLMLGSVEASFFSTDQLKSIEAFVARRGGGLMALGGRFAYDGGKYANTPISDLLPLYLNDRVDQPTDPFVPNFKTELTERGQNHPITRLSSDRTLNRKMWSDLPAVSVPEILSEVKPGATVLLEARGGGPAARSGRVPLLAEERYDRGRTLALTAADTWRWRMRMDSKSNAHEAFWRQALRYLVSTTPRQVEITTERDVYAVGDVVRIVADIRDKKYEPLRETKATARIMKPSGATQEIPLVFTSRDDVDLFASEVRADEAGQYRVELIASDKTLPGPVAADFLVTEQSREFFDATQNAGLLKRIAAETGGKYYTLDQANELIADLTYRESDNSERVSKDLWDMPINFFLLMAAISAEWFLRKREGLA